MKLSTPAIVSRIAANKTRPTPLMRSLLSYRPPSRWPGIEFEPAPCAPTVCLEETCGRGAPAHHLNRVILTGGGPRPRAGPISPASHDAPARLAPLYGHDGGSHPDWKSAGPADELERRLGETGDCR